MDNKQSFLLSAAKSCLLPIFVGIVAACFFAGWTNSIVPTTHYSQEKFFADESADIAQSYYFRLFFLERRLNDMDWLHYASFDHLPVFKYLIGLSLHCHGLESPTSLDRLMQWFQGNYDPYPADVLTAARLPMLLGAAFGCAMIFVLGRQLAGTICGLLAATALAASPLYFTHARRAMGDDLVQAFVLAALVCFVHLARGSFKGSIGWWKYLGIATCGGLCCALGAATKLNGGTSGLIIGLMAAACLTARSPRKSEGKLLWKKIGVFGGSLLMGVVAIAVFVGINPLFYANPNLVPESQRADGMLMIDGKPRTPGAVQMARLYIGMDPVQRFAALIDHRTKVGESGAKLFQDEFGLPTYASRLKAIVQDGMGTWTFVGRIPKEPAGKYGWILTGVFAVLGLCFAARKGWQASCTGQPPVEWVLVVWFLVELGVLIPGLVVNFDRYHLGIVTWTSIIVPYAITCILGAIGRRFVLPPPTERGKT